FQGTWYWRARAADVSGFYGEWSNIFSLHVDTTTPPGAVVLSSAAMGPGNGEITLQWVFPGDDKGAVAGGAYLIRYGASPITGEAAWQAAPGQSQGLLYATSGQVMTNVIDALSEATTYYFAIKTRDELGNESALSLTSPVAMTNASPTVTLVYPDGGETLSGTIALRWSAMDANPGDGLNVELRLSTSSGVSYDTLITSTLARGSTYYSWDSFQVPNAGTYRVRVRVVDDRGLIAEDVSASDFSTDNVNMAPVVTFLQQPATAERIETDIILRWSVSDVNVNDTHTFDLLLSDNGGLSYPYTLQTGLVLSSAVIATSQFKSLYGLGDFSTYRIKVLAHDSGSPSLIAAVETSIFEAVTGSGNQLQLLRPKEDSYPSYFDFSFAWTAPSDMTAPVVYTLYHSTVASLAPAITVSGLTQVAYSADASLFVDPSSRWWKVEATDAAGRKRISPVHAFSISPNRARSVSGDVDVTVVSGMPVGGYLALQDARGSHAAGIALADLDTVADPMLAGLSFVPWQVLVKDAAGAMLDASLVRAVVKFVYADADGDGVIDATMVTPEKLKIVKLDEASNRWRPVGSAMRVDRSSKTVAVDVDGFSVFTAMASPSAASMLSGVTNFPNPFAAGRQSTRVRYVLTQDADVNIRIYTQWGDLVRELKYAAGGQGGQGASGGLSNEVTWDGANGAGRTVGNGMYVMQLEALWSGGQAEASRLVGVLK
ncbi:MAG: hypothetical protein AABZ44_04520, partial [Elusimicrobiota bacterium]